MTFEEIGAALGMNMQTVFVIYARALHKIRRNLRQRLELRRALLGSLHLAEETRPRPQVFPDWGCN